MIDGGEGRLIDSPDVESGGCGSSGAPCRTCRRRRGASGQAGERARVRGGRWRLRSERGRQPFAADRPTRPGLRRRCRPVTGRPPAGGDRSQPAGRVARAAGTAERGGRVADHRHETGGRRSVLVAGQPPGCVHARRVPARGRERRERREQAGAARGHRRQLVRLVAVGEGDRLLRQRPLRLRRPAAAGAVQPPLREDDLAAADGRRRESGLDAGRANARLHPAQ